MSMPNPPAPLLKLIRWAADHSLLGSNDRIIRSFRMFAPMAAGSGRACASLTIQSAQQTFPFMLELLSSAGTKVEATTPIAMFADTEEKQAAALKLKELFDSYGSDKAVSDNGGHNYHLLYGPILAPRDASAVLEIGLGTNNVGIVSNMGRRGRPGASLRAFRDFLPGAQVYGADIDRDILFNEDRIATFFVDQTDISSFSVLGAFIPREFDLIIDDGLHSPNANLATLTFGLDRLKIGGYLVIEDISPHALELWQVVAAALLGDRYRSHIVTAEQALMFVVHRVA